MGKATRWFRGLLGKKKDKENVDTNSNTSSTLDKKKRWSFAKSSCNNNDSVVVPPKDSAVWLRSYIADTENDHAIAVAAATAAAADAAVAAAQAAVAVVRLTSRRGLRKEKSADSAVKIQTVFRGYLARKALGALKGLVKLQALVRGYLVRKRAAATLHSMQALIRAQATVRYQRACRSINNQTETRSRKSIERFDETRSEYHSQRLSASYDPSFSAFEKSSKIVEIDTCRPRSRSRRMNPCMSEYGDDDHYYHVVSGPLPCPVPARLSIPDCRHIQEFDWGFVRDDYKFATAQSTPRMACSGWVNMPITPPKSVCGDSFFRPYLNCPSYMANTESSRAKLRSLSAPKQRPEPCTKKRLSLNEIMASRMSFSGVKMQRSRYPQVEEEFEYEER